MKNRKIILLTLISCIILYFIATFCIYNLEKTHFAIGTTINNIDVSLKSIQNVYNILNDKDRTLLINENNQNYNIDLKEIADIKYSYEDIENALLQNNVNLFKIIDRKNIIIKENIQINDELTKLLFNAQIPRTKSKDSNFEVIDNNFVYNKAIYGNEIDFNKLIPKLLIAIQNNTSEFDITNEYYIKPKDVDYSDLCATNNKLLNHNITIKLYDENFFEINKDVIINFISTDENGNYVFSDNDQVILNINKIETFVDKLKEDYDTFGKSQNFMTTSGEIITIDTNCWGWQIDKDKTVQEIILSLYDYDKDLLEPIYSSTARNGENTIGNTYVEVSISDQHMWFYKDGELVLDAKCVTGDVSKNRKTPTGLYYILEKVNGKYLRGVGYKTWVNKWMRVTWSGIGLHDAYWRSSNEFGGNTYKTNGSHGCINLPPSAASDLYDLISLNDPVIIY